MHHGRDVHRMRLSNLSLVRVSDTEGLHDGTGLTYVVVPAAHHVLDHLIPVERVFVPHHAECDQAPVHRVHSQVCSEMVHKIIFVL